MYDLHKLGWYSFQQLCHTILREILGQTVVSYLDTNDGGRDGAFSGKWAKQKGESFKGNFVFQCKFTSKSEHTLIMSDLNDEFSKIERLVKEGKCDSYGLLTNFGISGRMEEEVSSRLHDLGVKHTLVYWSPWINQQIHESKRLRMLVPRVYGLGDLSEILDERAYTQAKALLNSLREDLAKVIITDSYRRAAEALDKHGFVLLIGEPAAGKTTIASLLAMTALDQWGASTLKLDDADKVIQHWNPDNPSQFFWVDDAFGVTQYESYSSHSWNHVAAQIKAMLHSQRAKIVMTSRDYIYNRARKDLKDGAFPLLEESQVVIDVHKLRLSEKQQILYNHLKLGRQPGSFRTKIKPFLESIALQPNFVPETARRLSEPAFTKDLLIYEYSLIEFVDKPEQFLKGVLQGLGKDSKAALGLIYMRNNNLESPIELQQSEETALNRLGSTLGECTSALQAMKDSLVYFSNAEGSITWKFKHPTIGDAYASILIENPELLGIYIQGSPVEKLINQITCGPAGIDKAISVPPSLYTSVLDKLEGFSRTNDYKSGFLSSWQVESRVFSFLATRASPDFLRLYINKHPEVLDKASNPGLYLIARSEVSLAIRLYEYEIFPEINRKKFVTTVSEYAIKGDDVYALQSLEIRKLFTKRNS